MSLSIYDYKDERLLRPVDNLLGIENAEREIINSSIENAWERCMYCFSKINNAKFNTGGIQIYHCVQYGMWLYFLGNEIYRRYVDKNNDDAINICDKLFMVNMSITQMDIYYGHNLPDIFLPAHTTGAIFSPHAKIGNYFMFMQGCNVGLKGNGFKGNIEAPCIGECVVMFGCSKIIGKCNIGDYVAFGANSYIKDMDIPSRSLVFGQYPNVSIVKDKNNMVSTIIQNRFHFG